MDPRRRILLFLLLVLGFFFAQFSGVSGGRHLLQNGTASSTTCPLDFDVIRRVAGGSRRPPNLDTAAECQYSRQALRLVLSDYLKRTGNFLPPPETDEECWESYDKLGAEFGQSDFDIRRNCGFSTSSMSDGCKGINTRAEFEANVAQSALNDVVSNCNQSLANGSPCGACTTSMSTLTASLNGSSVGNLTDCTAYGLIYAAAFANYLGPTDAGTLKCIFSLDFSAPGSNSRKKKIIISVVVTVSLVISSLLIIALLLYNRRRKKRKEFEAKKLSMMSSTISGLDSISGSTNLIRFNLDEITTATRNFSRDNIIGRGGYGNVYKGTLPDGSVVALKRFKNCSASGDATFTHEVEVIASVRHVNLVALRGYCVATTAYTGHQRIIVCDLIKNGSLHDHLFGMPDSSPKLSWPIRQRIALGTARGLAYLHYGAQPGIIHRDIKASNILLDENFDPKVADFGLAKFTPEGVTHMSTKVAGTMGYVAPEYALYGQLTERSDVYSFGVVLLELLSGRKALMAAGSDGQPAVVAEWAWELVRNGRALEVLDEGMPELGPPETLEKYVLIAVLCSHPQLYARPTMDQVVTMLEVENVVVPSIPERPIPLTSDMDDIQKSASSSGSGHLSTPRGYQAFSMDREFSLDTPRAGENRSPLSI